MNDQLIYLASPYNDEDADLREWRYQEAVRACAWLVNHNRFVYSPIVHWHPIATRYDLPKGWAFWQKADTLTLARCDLMLILTIDNWSTSKGIRAEQVFALEHGIPTAQLVPDGVTYVYANDEN